jgi:hypothetical protein
MFFMPIVLLGITISAAAFIDIRARKRNAFVHANQLEEAPIQKDWYKPYISNY